MAVAYNKNTTQTPVASGLTGTQSIKFIAADRVYVKTADSTAAPPTTKSNGSTPSGWTDLGSIENNVKLTYKKETKEVSTGIDEVVRQVYTGKKRATLEFSLMQFDDAAMANLTGLTASQIVNGSTYQFAVGTEDIVTKAVLLVSQNKLDGKEWQFYIPTGYINFEIDNTNDVTVLKGMVDMPMFTWASSEAIMVQSIFA